MWLQKIPTPTLHLISLNLIPKVRGSNQNFVDEVETFSETTCEKRVESIFFHSFSYNVAFMCMQLTRILQKKV